MKLKGYVFFLRRRFIVAVAATIFLLVAGAFLPLVGIIAVIIYAALAIVSFIDIVLLARISSTQIRGRRLLPERFSNGDNNEVVVEVTSRLNYQVFLKIIDELPFQFQNRSFGIDIQLLPGEEKTAQYELKPFDRGEYHFGRLLLFVSTRIGLFSRRLVVAPPQMVKVFPAFKEMRHFEMMAISNRLTEAGVRKIRRVGHQFEFDQIRDYQKGDDIRTINWKATARKNLLMVNQYQEERSQQVLSLIDMGRTMKKRFDGLSLLDYCINSSLVISDIAMLRHDKAGVVAFNDNVRMVVPPRNQGLQMKAIMEGLYNLETDFCECDYLKVHSVLRRHITQRSLIMLYANFESLTAVKRQLPVLLSMAANHLLVVVFFEDTSLKRFSYSPALNTEDIYVRTIAQKFVFDKYLTARFLESKGIHTIITTPGRLTVNAINKYLEFKARGMI
jgi:uncharacterized protein (DUF58 family)